MTQESVLITTVMYVASVAMIDNDQEMQMKGTFSLTHTKKVILRISL